MKVLPYSYSLGVFPTLELISAKPDSLTHLFLSSKSQKNSGVQKLLSFCQTHNIPYTINDKTLQKLGTAENTYAAGQFTKFISPLDLSANHVVLVGIRDMGNLGTIIRTLIGFNIHNLAIINPACDIFNPKVIRASMGAIFRLNFAYYASFSDYQNQFPHHNLYTFMSNAQCVLSNVQFLSPYALIFGSESSGLPAKFASLGTPVKIPQTSAIDSLNLSIAVAIGSFTAYTQNT
jgi:RNA methyltransferase, TrmH family